MEREREKEREMHTSVEHGSLVVAAVVHGNNARRNGKVLISIR